MNENEKILLLQLILEDIKGNWNDQEERVQYALYLAKELLNIEGMSEMVSTIEAYDFSDGRYFRDNYPYGYYNMDELHGLDKIFNNKSKEFKKESTSLLTYPEYRFEDWK